MAGSFFEVSRFHGVSRVIAMTFMAGALVACEGFDLDLRDGVGGFDTSSAARVTTAPRPQADSRGVISYPGYQVAVAQRGDTVSSVAQRVGVDSAALARFNGIGTDTLLREGEILALQTRIAEVPGGSAIDIAAIATSAIDNAPADAARPPQPVESASLPQGPEPIRHKVERGETAFTVARLYGVPVRSLAEWNGLGPDFLIREGQFLLIPVINATAPASVTGPGDGTATPTPPSSTTPVPEVDAAPGSQPTVPVPTPDIGGQAPAADSAEFLVPVTGSVIRAYAKGRNEGIDFGAEAGAAVKAADDGTVAAITRDTNGVAIVVIRHDGDLLTVYTQVDDLKVSKGDRVSRGQQIASVRAGNPSFLHFEVRNGVESVDPSSFLDL